MASTYYVCLLLSVLFLLPSCADLSTKHEKPAIKMPATWSSRDNKTKITSIKMNQVAWWKTFHDPQLNQLISDALVHNNDLSMAAGNIMQARASIQKIQAGWLPVLGLGGTAFKGEISDFSFQAPGVPFPIRNQDHSVHFDGYTAGFVPAYTLNIMQQLKLGKVAQYNLAMQEASINAVRLGVISQVAGSYFSLLGLQKQLSLQEQWVNDAKALRKYTQIQFQSGAVSQENLAVVDQLIASLQKKIPTLHYNITQVQNALNVLIDKNPGPLLTHNHFASIQTKGIIPINLPSETLKSRPDVAIAECQLQLKHAMIGVAASQLFPSINLTGLFGAASVDLGTLLRFGNGLGVGQLVGGIPLVNMEAFADIKKTKGERYTAYYNYVKTVRNAFAEVDNALSEHSTINESYEQQAVALKSARDQYLIAKKQYRQGVISYAATIMYKMNVDYMAAMLNESKMQHMASIVNLYQVLGGGYIGPVVN